MNLYAVSFFGHRQIDNIFVIEQRLETIIQELLLTKEYVEFFVGRDGEFDQLVASTIRRCKRAVRDDNSALVLVLPYATAEYRNNEQSFHEYYDEIEICAESAERHFKSAHQTRNRTMVNRSDLVVFCVEHNSGGAYQTFQYAKKANANIINLPDALSLGRILSLCKFASTIKIRAASSSRSRTIAGMVSLPASSDARCRL